MSVRNRPVFTILEVVIKTLDTMGVGGECHDRLLRGATCDDGSGRWLKIKGNRVIEV
jgi:hypothetical protein